MKPMNLGLGVKSSISANFSNTNTNEKHTMNRRALLIFVFVVY